MTLVIPTNPGVPVPGSATFDADAGANLAWQKAFSDNMENQEVLVVGDGGLLGRAGPLVNNSLDSTGLGGSYYGYGGAHTNASGGVNPFPTYNVAFIVEVHQADFGNNGDYIFQVATILDRNVLERKYRSRGLTTAGFSDWRSMLTKNGSGPNGSWTRFDDGTLICTKADISNSASMNAGQTLSGEWTYPASFSGPPDHVFATPRSSTSLNNTIAAAERLSAATGPNVSTSFWAVHAEVGISSVRVDLTAIGRGA